ncbi:uncharacterized protein LOC110813095 isoform X2 [Carica papaya]|uniref:uncharacterized protein LOC110813095 isoform X2 n=1 Tax=Carica papaya TaxID=3649 RepID=UPI000B8C8B8B|nr:uncharacterized protein LOC110813095 isoform X2 [Carica papaya]
MAFHFPLLHLFFLVGFVSAELILEDGYTVITVIDGHKLHINPYSVLPQSRSSDLIVLDSSSSTFYTVSFPISEGSSVKRLSGDGIAGHVDGKSGHARFNKPRSFSVDARGNVYVADPKNHAIRKISISGTVTTIAGGYSNKTGSGDGPAQNASFSDNFEIIFVPERCVLLISDHGNQLIRQIDLKVDDCTRSSPSALGAASVWFLGLALSCLLGMAIGVAVRPYIIPHTGGLQGPQFQQDMEALPNQSGEASTDALLRHQKRSC